MFTRPLPVCNTNQNILSFQYIPPTAIDTTERLKNLRQLMTENNLKAYIVPSEDAHLVNKLTLF